MKCKIEELRNPYWKDWYPRVAPDFSKFKLGMSPYGPPNSETLVLFDVLKPSSRVLDACGGDGR